MGKSNVSIEGMPELQARLANMGEEIRRAVELAVDDSADAVEGTMRRLVPVDSGDLQRGITTKKRGSLLAQVGVFSKKLYYAQFVEHGTSSSPAQPFMLPAAEVERSMFPKRISDAVSKAVGK